VTRSSERGFSLVELAAVMIVLMVLAGLWAMSAQRSQTDSGVRVGIAAALSLHEAIEQFQRDRGGRLPGPVGSADWTPGSPYLAGVPFEQWISPVDIGNGGKPYLATAARAEIISQVLTVQSPSPATPRPTTGAVPKVRVSYIVNSAGSGFIMLVERLTGGTTYVPHCWVASNAATAVPMLPPPLTSANRCQ
jgi:type II secretory pathway pseudopilin PulG